MNTPAAIPIPLSVETSPNYLLRRKVLETARVIYAA